MVEVKNIHKSIRNNSNIILCHVNSKSFYNIVYSYLVKEALDQIGLEKYCQLFECEEIDYNAFLQLNDDDLCNLEIPTGSRKKILSIVKTLRDNNEGKGLKIDHLIHI